MQRFTEQSQQGVQGCFKCAECVVIFNGLAKILEEKEKFDENAPANVPTADLPKMAGEANAENVKAKMDLVLTQIQSLNVRQETLNERLNRIEKMIEEIYRIAKA